MFLNLFWKILRYLFFSLFGFCTSSTKTNVISFKSYLIVILYFRYWLFFSFCLFSGLFRHFLLHKLIHFILKSTSQMHAYNKVRLWKKKLFLRLLNQIRFFLSVSIYYFSISYCHVCKENWRAILIILYINTGAYFFVCLFVNKQIKK